jgi:diadenosine tetraphosphate (Ap4A) HIT family hydrolase
MICPLCERVKAGDLLAENELAVAFADAFPVTAGHSLVVPRRHEPDYFALSGEERRSMWVLVDAVRSVLDRRYDPDGYNIGINVGTAAGQTIPHAHLHVIPRYAGDVDDPRGGIRWVIPQKAAYWRR